MSGGNDGMRKLIMVVNRLQDAFAATGLPFGLELPQIAVVGGQSVGKSSVLESFVGRDFLPRGIDIITRCPLVLQLMTHSEEYAEFQHLPGRKFEDFDTVRHEIQRETDRETGNQKGISAKPINLKIYSPHVLNLTLIDLPGMTRVAVGDQPDDIEKQIRKIVMDYISKENTLILAVSAANTDLANSDAMKVAKAADPRGLRTIGVLTKLDIMDPGTNARLIFMGEKLPLKRGYIGVVNRSQQDIQDGRDIDYAMDKERHYFRSEPVYRDMADRMGTPHLQLVLNQELSRHIHETLPRIKVDLSSKVIELRRELEKVQDLSSPEAMRELLMKLVNAFAESLKAQIEGLDRKVQTKHLDGGATINKMFYNEFANELDLEDIPVGVLREDISMAIQNFRGIRNGIFTPDMAFEATVHNIITEFHQPVKNCAILVAQVLETIVDRAADEIKHERLRTEVEKHVKEYLYKRLEITQDQLITHVDAEAAFTNYRHEDFVGNADDAAHHSQGTPEFTQTLDNVKRKLDHTAKYLQKGFLLVNGMKKGHYEKNWFTLTQDTISWFTNKKETDELGTIRISQKVKQRLEQRTSDKLVFTLYRSDNRPLFHEFKSIELACSTDLEMSSWLAAFKSCGIYAEDNIPALEVENEAPHDLRDVNEPFVMIRKTKEKQNYTQRSKEELRDVNEPFVKIRKTKNQQDYTQPARSPELEKQIDTVQIMVQSYLQIVGKTMRDMIPKYIVLLLVYNTQNFVKIGLTPKLMHSDKEVIRLMKMDEGEAERRAELQQLYLVAENALSIINEASSFDI